MLKTRLIAIYASKVGILLSYLVLFGFLTADVVSKTYWALGSSASLLFYIGSGLVSGVMVFGILFGILILYAATANFLHDYNALK